MKKEMTLSVNSAREVRVSNIFASVKAALMLPIVWLSLYYSAVLKMEINTRSTLHLLNVQVAFLLAVLPANAPFVARLICTAWFALALRGCKRNLSSCKRK